MKNEKEITVPLAHPLDGRTRPRAPRKKSEGRTEELVHYLRERVGVLDGTELDNRRAAWQLILKAEANGSTDAVRDIKLLVDIALRPDNWHRPNVTSYKYLNAHGSKIANAHRERKATGADKLRAALEANAVHHASQHDAGGGGWT